MRFYSELLGYAALLEDLHDLTVQWGGNPVWVVGSNVEYSIYQEYGTYKMSAQPHLRPAIDSTEVRMAEFAQRADDLDHFMELCANHLTAETQRRAPVDTGTLRASYAPPIKLQ